jgi:cbb3-type cytochrome c oxidase subunit II
VAVAAPPRDAAPFLEGRRESLGLLLTGVLGLLVVGVLLVFVVPASVGGDERHIVGEAPLTSLEADGREIYLEQGCQYCHTQNVRPVIADVGLGPVTETDARSLDDPATFGVQRIGPDLAHVASRLPEGEDPAAYVAEFLRHPTEVNPDSGQPAYRYLSDDDLAALVAYVLALK